MAKNGVDSKSRAKSAIANLHKYVYFYVTSVFYVFDAIIAMILLVVMPFFVFFFISAFLPSLLPFQKL
jgi:hypothetical protein